MESTGGCGFDRLDERKEKKVRDTRNEGSVIRRYLIKSKRKK